MSGGTEVHAVSYGNPWLTAVEGARRPIPALAALPIAILVLAASLYGGVRLYGLAAPGLQGTLPGLAGLAADRTAQILCVLGLLYLAAWALGLGYERRPRPNGGTHALLALGLGLLTGAAGLALALGGAALLGAVGGAAAPVEMAPTLLVQGVFVSALLFALQVGAEEVFFRGWLQPILCLRWGPWVGLAATSVIFGAAHSFLQPVSLLASLNIVLAGAVFGLLALRTGGLWAPFAAHWIWNWGEQSIAGALPNPGVDAIGSVFDVDLAGPALFSGGADALNGALSTTIVLTLLLVVFVLWGARSPR
jgi:hypothetical protein